MIWINSKLGEIKNQKQQTTNMSKLQPIQLIRKKKFFYFIFQGWI